MARQPTGDELFEAYIRRRWSGAELPPLDTYDLDFLLGAMMEWLGENNAVLTARGIEKVSDITLHSS